MILLKKIFKPLAIVIAASLIYLSFLYFRNINYNQLNILHKYIASRISDKWENKISSLEEDLRPLVELNTLLVELNFWEREFIIRMFNINPANLGFNGPFYSINSINSLLVRIPSLRFNSSSARETGIQYCLQNIYDDFEKMNEEMKKDINRRLFIESGYRSPGRQAYLFVKYLVSNNGYSLKENAKWIAMPGYSEHGHFTNHALDLVNEEGINGFSENQSASDFENLQEYRWLLERASEFNFYLSYPRNNNLGVEFEPWHWHWESEG